VYISFLTWWYIEDTWAEERATGQARRHSVKSR
jgi:hypothetical protein